MTYTLFKENGFNIDECHFTSDAAVVYTYIHLKLPVELDVIALFLDKMTKENRIIPFEVFGYDSIAACGSEISDHIGFKILMNHYQNQNPLLSTCTDGKPGIVRGVFWRSDSLARMKEILNQRSKRLGVHFDELQKELSMYKEKAEMIDFLHEEAMEYQAKLQRYREKNKVLGRYKFVCRVLQCRIGNLDKKTREYLLEDDHNGRPLFESNGADLSAD